MPCNRYHGRRYPLSGEVKTVGGEVHIYAVHLSAQRIPQPYVSLVTT
jgi:hypothetical protein